VHQTHTRLSTVDNRPGRKVAFQRVRGKRELQRKGEKNKKENGGREPGRFLRNGGVDGMKKKRGKGELHQSKVHTVN